MNIKIALTGNPNSGKTTLFNALTGSNQYVGNWPGVTVEKKEGQVKGNPDIIVTDLPGIYSLSPYTMEEVVARNYIINESPDVILNVIDGTNLERNLYLTTQLVEVGLPVVIAINMMDVVRRNGDEINIKELEKALGCKIVEISALKGLGIEEAVQAALAAARAESVIPRHIFSGPVEHAIAHIEERLLHDMDLKQQRWYAIKLFERDEKVIEALNISKEMLEHIEEDILAAEEELDDDAEGIIASERYNYVEKVIDKSLHKKSLVKFTLSDKIDNIITHRIFGLPIFAAIMFVIYYVSVSGLGGFLTDWTTDELFGEGFYLFGSDIWIPGIPTLVSGLLDVLGVTLDSTGAIIRGIVLDGFVAGVGSVLSFVPQIAILFLFLSFLEGCGYMSRIAFVLDRAFRRIGLSGKSFIPILVGTGCSVPGIMASRTIESEKDRRMTIITTSFIPCGAKLPFIALISGAIFGGAPWVAPSAYFLGIVAIIMSGLILKKTRLFAGEDSPFVMELPPYHMPTAQSVLRNTWDKAWSFVKKATTIILLSTVIIWFFSNYGFIDGKLSLLSKEQLHLSILANIGSLISWIFIPLGFGTWQAAVATITGLVAKENIVSTLGVLYSSGGNVYENIRAAFAVNGLEISGYAFLVFNLLCAPCFAAMGAIRREMNSPKWFWIAIGYQTGLAYLVSLIVYQLGRFATGYGFGIGTVAALICCLMFLILLLRPEK